MSDATPECRTVMNRMGLPNLPKFKLGESDEEKAEKAEKAGRAPRRADAKVVIVQPNPVQKFFGGLGDKIGAFFRPPGAYKEGFLHERHAGSKGRPGFGHYQRRFFESDGYNVFCYRTSFGILESHFDLRMVASIAPVTDPIELQECGKGAVSLGISESNAVLAHANIDTSQKQLIISFTFDKWMQKVAAQRLGAALVTDGGRQELQDLYESLDADGDATLTALEWSAGLKANPRLLSKYFHGSSMEEIVDIFHKIDVDGNGALSWDEFLDGAKKIIRSQDADMDAEREAWLKLWCTAIPPQNVHPDLQQFVSPKVLDILINDYATQEEITLSSSLVDEIDLSHADSPRRGRSLHTARSQARLSPQPTFRWGEREGDPGPWSWLPGQQHRRPTPRGAPVKPPPFQGHWNPGNLSLSLGPLAVLVPKTKTLITNAKIWQWSAAALDGPKAMLAAADALNLQVIRHRIAI